MYEPQHLFDLQDNLGNAGSDPKSWLSGADGSHHLTGSSPSMLQRTHSSLSNASASASANVDHFLYKEFAEILPLIQSLIDVKQNTKFTRRGSMIYTKTPSRESHARKTTDPKARNAVQSISTKRRKDQSKNSGTDQDASSESFSMFSSKSFPPEKDSEELMALREQIADLQRKLSEKEELLKSLEISKFEMDAIQAKLDEMKIEVAEKDSLLNSTQLQLSDVKIKLADKQAAVEKLQWEATTSNQRVEKLQKDLEMMQGEISLFTSSFEVLAKKSSAFTAEDYDIITYPSYQHHDIDDLNDADMQKLEVAREAYVAAVAAAKEKQDEESLATAACARLHLQSFAMGTKSFSG